MSNFSHSVPCAIYLLDGSYNTPFLYKSIGENMQGADYTVVGSAGSCKEKPGVFRWGRGADPRGCEIVVSAIDRGVCAASGFPCLQPGAVYMITYMPFVVK